MITAIRRCACILLFAFSLATVCSGKVEKDAAEVDFITHPIYGKEANVTCGVRDITVALSEDFLERYSSRITSVERICFINQECCATNMGDKTVLRIARNFAMCGNEIAIKEELSGGGEENTRFYEFSNRVIYSDGDGLISRDITLVKFRCRYAMDQLVTAKPRERRVTRIGIDLLDCKADVTSHVIKIKKLGGDMGLYNDDTFNEKYQPSTEKKENVFVKIQIQNPLFPSSHEDLNLVSVIRHCIVKDATTDYPVVENGCPLNQRAEIFSTGNSMASSLRIDVGEFLTTNIRNVTIKCMMDLCIKQFPTSCERTCTRRGKRSPGQNASFGNSSPFKYQLQFDGKEVSTPLPLLGEDYLSKAQIDSPNPKEEGSNEVEKSAKNTFKLVVAISFVLALTILISCLAILLMDTSRDKGSVKESW